MKNRQILARIWEKVDSPEIILLSGARQVGKTTLLQMVKEKLRSEKDVLPEEITSYDLERSTDLEIWSDQNRALSRLSSKPQKSCRHYLFIDEFQRVKSIGSTLKVIHDHYPWIKCFISGSATWYLNIEESLAGRKRVFNIWPLSFAEYLEWQSSKEPQKDFNWAKDNIQKIGPETVKTINEQLQKFLAFGGYPSAVLSENGEDKINLLAEMIDSYLVRDIKIWNYAANTLQIKKLLTLLADRTGALLNLESLASDLSLSRSILENRLGLLLNTFLLVLLPPYFTNKTKELTKNRKIHFVDNGLRHSLLNNFGSPPGTAEFGKSAENFVLTEMAKNAQLAEELFYWRTKTKQEVDIVKKTGDALIPIEVKSGSAVKIENHLQAFIKKYSPASAYILNWSTIKDEKFGNCEVLFRPLWFAGII